MTAIQRAAIEAARISAITFGRYPVNIVITPL
jgi:hypothetical protein